jgi:hypothetical protein
VILPAEGRDTQTALIPIARPTFAAALAGKMTVQVRKSPTRAGGVALPGPEELGTGAEEPEAAMTALAGKPIDLLPLLQATFADRTLAMWMAEKIEAP